MRVTSHIWRSAIRWHSASIQRYSPSRLHLPASSSGIRRPSRRSSTCWVGLHTNYPGTQLAFAVSELSSNKHIDLVTLSIGSNDVLLLLAQCSSNPDPTGCVNTKLAAGLVIRLTPTTCDIHPTPLGRDILAATIMAAVAAH